MSTPERNESEVAQLLQRINAEYTAASLGLSGLAMGTSIHKFITARLEGIENARQELVELVGDEMEATRLVCGQINKSADSEEELTQEEAQNLTNYFSAVNAEIEKIENGPNFPINGEYCWIHQGENLGGWTCQDPECKGDS